MTEYGKAQIQALGAGIVGFVVVVGAGALLMFPQGKVSVKAPVSNYAPVDVTSNLTAPVPISKPSRVGAPEGEAVPADASPAPILSEDERGESAEAPAPAAAPAASSPAAPAAPARPQSSASAKKLAVTEHLDGTSSAKSSAEASVALAPAKPSSRVAKNPLIAPKLDLTKTPQGSLASSVHYGVNDRAELMGRAAGPVYNFAGRNVGKSDGQAPTAPIAAPLDQVDAAQKQIQDSNLSDADKATINATLGKVRATAAQP